MLAFIKRFAPEAPRFIGEVAARVPYEIRLGYGADYRNALKTIRQFEDSSSDFKRAFIFERIKTLVELAFYTVPFYRRFYVERGFSPEQLCSFDDIGKIPVVTKDLLQTVPLEERSAPRRGRVATFTGGSTGEPFKFYSDPRQIGNEWAHIHVIWKKLGYCQKSLLLSVALEPEKPRVFYDALRHSIVLNVHYPRNELIEAFLALPFKRRQVRFFRGYPSAWAEILAYGETSAPDFLIQLRRTLRGSLLASEYPFPHFREVVERTTQCPTISWYGLSERCVLAYEKTEDYLYEPMQSYGYCEALETSDGRVSLVGTAYWNSASPFIRYQIDDIIEPVEIRDGLLRSFRISEGRSGDYLVDKNGQKFSITHLNLSCRESTWEIVRCVQVEQTQPGKVTFWITPRREISIEQAKKAFDFDRLNLDCAFRFVDAPFLSRRGKTPLRITDENVVRGSGK
ncbi:MAG: hypothetical protein IJM30_05200 [Thermoguttaceae bacterium]|nr:hypothetical protein [Thermoguttaceae bacterium]